MKYIKWFLDVSIRDIAIVGGKNASLGEMIQFLKNKQIRVPEGFAITSEAYWYFLNQNKLISAIKYEIDSIKNYDDLDEIFRVSTAVRQIFDTGIIPPNMVEEIDQAYLQLCKMYNAKNISVAVRSSATAEDLPTASFAGQQESFLNVEGLDELLVAIKKCMSSLFTPRAIVYRYRQGFDHFKVALSVGVQKMVRSDLGCSGVAFSLDTESGFADVITIESSWGLGEAIVQGLVTPDLFVTHKPTVKKGFASIIQKKLGDKLQKIIYALDGMQTKMIETTLQERSSFSLSDEHILDLSHAVIAIEDLYSQKKESWCPMDIEWAVDGQDNNLYIIQARPETIHSAEKKDSGVYQFAQYSVEGKNKDLHILTTGQSIGKKAATGIARVVTDISDISQVQQGDIIITRMTDPDWVPVMKKAAGIVTQQGGRTCHAAIVSRELGLPAIVGARDVFDNIMDNEAVTIDCSRGSVGYVYQGTQTISKKIVEVKKDIVPPVSIMLNIADPSQVFELADLPVCGVGLARLEFIIANNIGIHPRACIQQEKIVDQKIVEEIKKRSCAYENSKDFFVQTLAQGMSTIAAAFYPHKVIVRCSDFKTNEYQNLLGGIYFEPQEENPMLGFRGASRYYHESFLDAFALECQAFKIAREQMGFDNIAIMIPFVRTVTEAKKVIDILKDNGLCSGENNLQLYMMCELPSNVILMEQFAQYFDGFSIGSNDLTQLILGVDRDSELVASLFDEQNEAVKQMISQAITRAHAQQKQIGICGQAPSDYSQFAQFLIEQGIDSISLNADVVLDFIQKKWKFKKII